MGAIDWLRGYSHHVYLCDVLVAWVVVVQALEVFVSALGT